MSPVVKLICGLATLITICSAKTCPGNAPKYEEQPKNMFVASLVTRTQWDKEAWPSNECQPEFSKVDYITIHHTAGPQISSLSAGKSQVKSIQHTHKTRADDPFTDIGYHFLIDSVGNVYQGRPFYDDDEMQDRTPVAKDHNTYKWPRPRFVDGAHVTDKNHNNLGISVMGCYADKKKNKDDKHGCASPNIIKRYDQTYTNLVQLISYLCKYAGIGDKCIPGLETVRSHKSWKATACPGHIDDMIEDIRKDVKMSMDGNGLCTDYSKTGIGGKCIFSPAICPSGQIISAGNSQCQSGQRCCSQSAASTPNTGKTGTTPKTGSPPKTPSTPKTDTKSKTKWPFNIKMPWHKAYSMDTNLLHDEEYQYTNGVYDTFYHGSSMNRGYTWIYIGLLLGFGLFLLCVGIISLVCGGACGWMVGYKLNVVKQEIEHQDVNQYSVVIDE